MNPLQSHILLRVLGRELGPSSAPVPTFIPSLLNDYASHGICSIARYQPLSAHGRVAHLMNNQDSISTGRMSHPRPSPRWPTGRASTARGSTIPQIDIVAASSDITITITHPKCRMRNDACRWDGACHIVFKVHAGPPLMPRPQVTLWLSSRT